MGRTWLETENYKELIKTYSKYVEDFEDSGISDGLLYWLGMGYMADGDFQNAGKTFGQITENYPVSPLRRRRRIQAGRGPLRHRRFPQGARCPRKLCEVLSFQLPARRGRIFPRRHIRQLNGGQGGHRALHERRKVHEKSGHHRQRIHAGRPSFLWPIPNTRRS